MPALTQLNPQTAAFLDMLAESEGTIHLGDNGYNVLVGSTPEHPRLFTSFTAHPGILNVELKSTAAGRYQLLYRYWLDYSKSLHLDSFKPENQDRIAIQQISEAGALPYIHDGDIDVAVAKCAHLWASLPGNDYEQHEQKMTWLTSMFKKHGGFTE